jgi:hypothetical protein
MIIVIFLSGTINAFSQNKVKLSGEILNQKNELIESGDVVLMTQKDSSVVKSSIIIHGHFSFDLVETGDYFLKISSTGFYDEIRAVSLLGDTTVNFALKVDAKILQGVNVVSTKPVFSNRNGNLVMNVNNTIYSEIPATLDLFSKLPGILISPDKQSILAVGKGAAVIYIDNQKMGVNDLNSLSVRDIENIEIINNPPAKYDADGRVVILVTKKISKTDGTKIDLSETASLKRFYNNTLGINLSFRRRRLEIKSDFQYSQLKIWESNSYEFRIADQDIQTNYSIISILRPPQFRFGAGIFYQINKDDYVSITTNARSRVASFPNASTSYIKNGAAEDNILTTTLNNNSRVYLSSNVNYGKKLKKIDGQLFLGGQYSNYKEDLKTDVFNNYNNTTSNFTLTSNQQYHIDVFSTKVDFQKFIANKIQWQTGATMSYANALAISNIRNFSPPDTAISNYRYIEKIYAGYTQLSRKSKNVNYSAGVRVENMKVEGGFEGKTLLIDRNTLYVFPKASVDFLLDSNRTLSFSYAKSITRPNFSNLSQITIYLNPFTRFSRNINLKPTLTHEASINFHYKDKFFRLFYYRQSDPVYFGTEYNEQQKTLIVIDKNYKSESGANISITIPVRYKFWNSTNVFIGNISKVSDQTAILNKPRPSFYFYSSHQLKLPKEYNLLVSAWYLSKRYTGLYERSFLSSVDLGMSKTFSKRFTFAVNWNDIFRTLNFGQKFIINSIYSNGIYYEDVREFSISIRCVLGEIKSVYKNVNVDENLERIK